MVQHHINEEMCTIFVVFPLFCPSPIFDVYLHVVYLATLSVAQTVCSANNGMISELEWTWKKLF
jgi:hypothetical protein